MSASYLHRHQPVVHQDLLRQEVCANSSFVTRTEFLADLVQKQVLAKVLVSTVIAANE